MEGALAAGAASLGPFDVVVVEGAFEVPPNGLFAQLADWGRLVGIDATANGTSQAVLYEKKGGAISRRALFETRADCLDGFRLEASFAF